MFSDNQRTFISFVFDTFDFLAPETTSFLQIVQNIIHSNVVSPRNINIVFKRIDFVIQKGLAAELVVCLSFFHVLLFYILYLLMIPN
jgi:hypothetical protein